MEIQLFRLGFDIESILANKWVIMYAITYTYTCERGSKSVIKRMKTMTMVQCF